MPIAKENATDFKPVPAGTHFGRCFGVIAIGTQPANNPKFRPTNRVLLLFELPNETYELDGKQLPCTISKEYNLSINRKANLRKDLDSWRGRPFTEEEACGFPVEKVIDVPCTLSITHEQKKDGTGVYARVASISGLPKGVGVAPMVHKPVHYELEMERNQVFEALPEWIQDKIGKCMEWNEGKTAAPPPAEQDNDDGLEDEVPF